MRSSATNLVAFDTEKRLQYTAQGQCRIARTEPGDPNKLADVLVTLQTPPIRQSVRLPLGSDAVAAIEEKHRKDTAILNEWRPVSVSTDFPSPQ
jgi:hypothetical protein